MTLTDTSTFFTSTLKSPEPPAGINLKIFPFRLQLGGQSEYWYRHILENLQKIGTRSPDNRKAELDPESAVLKAGVPDQDHTAHLHLLGVVKVDITGLHGARVDVIVDLDLQWKHREGVQHRLKLTAMSG